MSGEYKQSWLDWEAMSGGRAVLHGTPEEIKAMYVSLVQALTPMMPAFTSKVDIVEGDVGGIKYRMYAPQEGATDKMPVGINAHGGGFMTGDLDSDHVLCAVISEHTKTVVINIDYRLTPDYVWPTQLDDCMSVYEWAVANAHTFKGDPEKFYTIGGSAGGALALQMCNKVVQDPKLKSSIKGVAAIVPSTVHWESVPEKYKSKYNAYKENATDVPIIDKESMETFFKYFKADPKDPECFTLLATDNHKNYPPVYFASCEFDPLRDDAYVMEEALQEAGVKTKHDHYKGFPHYFWIIPAVPEGQEFVQNLIKGIEWLKSQM